MSERVLLGTVPVPCASAIRQFPGKTSMLGWLSIRS
jgi:hypothetical protein